ncbi:hypothetical protein B0I35DRAFT_152890 [Stachybotrys elegans]|uniref:Uncharacterized protein n=1 Tax=Stachybotrys elegans TaxID=80388 RepID=A0A8K0WJD2_9HYPO|nr:hypothetical protein B0I35DRAFT_152890 [Stachybotrys elegans]
MSQSASDRFQPVSSGIPQAPEQAAPSDTSDGRKLVDVKPVAQDQDKTGPGDVPLQSNATRELSTNDVMVDGDGRPHIREQVTRPRFHAGDKVYLLRPGRIREGPYLVSGVSAGRFMLCNESGVLIDGGQEFDANTLLPARRR